MITQENSSRNRLNGELSSFMMNNQTAVSLRRQRTLLTVQNSADLPDDQLAASCQQYRFSIAGDAPTLSAVNVGDLLDHTLRSINASNKQTPPPDSCSSLSSIHTDYSDSDGKPMKMVKTCGSVFLVPASRGHHSNGQPRFRSIDVSALSSLSPSLDSINVDILPAKKRKIYWNEESAASPPQAAPAPSFQSLESQPIIMPNEFAPLRQYPVYQPPPVDNISPPQLCAATSYLSPRNGGSSNGASLSQLSISTKTLASLQAPNPVFRSRPSSGHLTQKLGHSSVEQSRGSNFVLPGSPASCFRHQYTPTSSVPNTSAASSPSPTSEGVENWLRMLDGSIDQAELKDLANVLLVGQSSSQIPSAYLRAAMAAGANSVPLMIKDSAFTSPLFVVCAPNLDVAYQIAKATSRVAADEEMGASSSLNLIPVPVNFQSYQANGLDNADRPARQPTLGMVYSKTLPNS
ncbi:hypothetical protein Ciccas_003594 [Cichlidogyrus casuarinus]|uniref:Uncharacterized protein n=1 Tax=Cichlidogyrus casuarinus TaxID=1844966 RepID=A0ABD2QDY3_9PLAT